MHPRKVRKRESDRRRTQPGGDWAFVVSWREVDAAGIPAIGFHDHDLSSRPR
jgi:hypothetical protein